MPKFHPGQHVRIEGVSYVCKRTLPDHTIVLEEIRTLRPRTVTVLEALMLYARGTLNFVAEEDAGKPNFGRQLVELGTLDEAIAKEAQRKLAYVVEVDGLGQGRTKREVANLIRAVAERINDTYVPNVHTVLRWQKQWRSSNCDIRALISRPNKRRGRFKWLPAPVRQIMNKVIREVYLTRPRSSIAETYRCVVAEIEIVNRSRPHDDQLPTPSLATVYREIKSLVPYDVVCA